MTEEEYARVGEVQAGDVLVAGGGFTCLKEGEKLLVQGVGVGLFVNCKMGRHYLSGQEENGTYIGLRKCVRDAD